MHATLPPPPHLPLVHTSFVGRQQEITAISQLLASTSVVSLVGAGGCGKTRIALRVAAEVYPQYADGVYWVELAPVVDPALVPQVVAKTVKAAERADASWTDAVLNALHDKHMLLVFDNCEHLREACTHLAEILMRAPHLKMLVTSREGLDIQGEALYPILPLAVHSTNQTFAEIAQSEAVQLFVDRARNILPSFGLTPENAIVVATICRDLDGIPLAIELASARVNVLSVQQIQALLNHRLDVLIAKSHGEARHHTLRATMDWSYALLSSVEQLLLRRLAVFAAGFTLNTAEVVCAWEEIPPEHLLDLLTSLVNKSLVVAETMLGSEARYHMLETIRQYAHEKLRESGEWTAIRDHYLACFVQQVEEVAPKLRDQYQQLWLNWLESELDNLRAAMTWALERTSTAAGLRIATALYHFWETRGYIREGMSWFERLFAPTDHTVPLDVHVNALVYASFLAMLLHDGKKSTAFSQQAVDRCEAAGEAGKPLLTFALAGLASAANATGDSQLAYDLCMRQVDMYRLAKDVFVLNMTLFVMGMYATALGNYETAHQHLDEGLTLARQAHDPYRIANVLKALGELARCEHDFPQARLAYEESLALFCQIDAPRDIPDINRHLAYVCLYEGDTRYARQLLHEAAREYRKQENQEGMLQTVLGFAALAAQIGLFEESACLLGFLTGGHLAPAFLPISADRITFEQTFDHVQAALDETRCAAAQAKGHALSLEHAIELALAMPPEPDATLPEIPQALGDLTPREREVATLIARGQPNGDIANALVLSKRTVEHHIASILSKRGFTNRAQIVRWALEHGLTDVAP